MLVTLRNHFHFVYIDDLFLACNFALRKVYFSRINVAITQLQTDSKSTMNPKICNRDLLNERITFYSRFTNLCPYCFQQPSMKCSNVVNIFLLVHKFSNQTLFSLQCIHVVTHSVWQGLPLKLSHYESGVKNGSQLYTSKHLLFMVCHWQSTSTTGNVQVG